MRNRQQAQKHPIVRHETYAIPLSRKLKSKYRGYRGVRPLIDLYCLIDKSEVPSLQTDILRCLRTEVYAPITVTGRSSELQLLA